MRNLFTILFLTVLAAGLQAQPLVQVTDINDATQTMLMNCNDTSSYYQDTVKVVCYVVTSGNLSEVSSGSITGANGTRPFIWVNDTANGGTVGPNTGLEIMGVNWSTNQATAGFTSLIAGDLVEITGVVGMFNNATQFQPLDNNSINILAGTSPTITPAIVEVQDLNDQNQVNNLVTGEQWQGAFVTVRNVTVTNVNNFGSGTGARIDFTVADSTGATMQVYDFFLAQKLSSWPAINPNSPASFGAFSPPSVGTFFDSLTGVIEHSGNGCTGGTGQGYRMHPFDSTHYVVGKAVPNISAVSNSPTVPGSTDPIIVSADVIDSDGNVDSVNIFWSTNPTAPVSTFTKAAMTLSSGITYEYTISAQPNGTNIRYYIEATDNDQASTFWPSAAPGAPTATANIFVRDGGLSIMDVQTPFGSADNSPFEGQQVTIKGFVTAGERDCDLGYVYIQDTSASEYSAIALRGSLDLANLYRNEYVQASGTIQESFGFTQMLIDSVKSLGAAYEVQPVELDPSDSNMIPDLEKYESMLITYKNPNAGGKIYIANPNLGFAEYSISSIQGASTNASRRVIAGRQSGGSGQSSLYVQLLSDTSQYVYLLGTAIPTNSSMTMDAMTGVLWYSFGNFKITPRNNNDIVGLSVQLDTTGCTTPYFSIRENVVTKDLQMYPNPAANEVTIEGFDGKAQISIYDLKGSLVRSATGTNSAVISVSDLHKGMYLVRVTAENTELLGTYKLIVTH